RRTDGRGEAGPRGRCARSRERLDRGALPGEVRELVSRAVVTPAHVDVLLALRRSAPRDCRLQDLADAAALPNEPVARRCVAELVDAGLVAPSADASTFRYAPTS